MFNSIIDKSKAMLALRNLKDGHLKMSLFKQYQLIMNPCLSEATHTEKNNPGGQPKALWGGHGGFVRVFGFFYAPRAISGKCQNSLKPSI